MAEYDVIVLGAGAVGENVADRAVQGGLTAALVESELVGGECSYWACMPSKALLRSGQALRAARRDSFTSNWSDEGQVGWVQSAGIELVRGHGRLTGEKQVTVGDTVLTARHAVVVATGSDAVVPG